MYNLRVKNILSLCTCARNSLLEECIQSPFFSVKADGKDLVLLGFSNFRDAKEIRERIKYFLESFCFLCADDCLYRIQYKIEGVNDEKERSC